MKAVKRSPEHPETRIAQQASKLQALMMQLMQPPLESEGSPLLDVELSPREVKVLMLLSEKEEMIMTDLAEALNAPLSTVTRTIDRLEKKAVIERFRSNQDRRIVVVREGEKGKLLNEHMRRSQLDTARRMLKPLSPGEREILLELIDKLLGGLRSEN